MVNKCFSDASWEGEQSSIYGHSGLLCAVRGYYEEAQALVCLLDGNWGSDIDRRCHFGRSSLLEYGSEYISGELVSPMLEIQGFSRSTKKLYGRLADTEWKGVLSRQQASVSDLASKDRYEEIMDIVWDSNLKEDVMKTSTELSTISICCASSKTGGCPVAGISKPQRVRMIQPVPANAAILSHKDSPLWYTAKGHAGEESCDLSSLTGKEGWAAKGCATSTRSNNFCHPPSLDELYLASSPCEGEPIPLENTLSTMSTMGAAHLMPSCGPLSGVTEPSFIQSIPQRLSIDNSFNDEKTHWKASNEEGFDAMNKKYEILGKALCHAQTRARLAEKLAAQALQDRERLEQLLLREVRTACRYRQRAQMLELENKLLKLCSKIDLEVLTGSEVFYPCGLIEQRARTSRRKLSQKRCACHSKVSTPCQDKNCNFNRSQKRSILLSCTLGLAFFLGLSFAGAGLMIGWSLSWMFFS